MPKKTARTVENPQLSRSPRQHEVLPTKRGHSLRPRPRMDSEPSTARGDRRPTVTTQGIAYLNDAGRADTPPHPRARHRRAHTTKQPAPPPHQNHRRAHPPPTPPPPPHPPPHRTTGRESAEEVVRGPVRTYRPPGQTQHRDPPHLHKHPTAGPTAPTTDRPTAPDTAPSTTHPRRPLADRGTARPGLVQAPDARCEKRRRG
jgi:hypothetical protein